jgi:radical SAM protein with 4Fe4S-binding SPASM domain
MRPFHLPGSYLVLEMTNGCSLACTHCSVAEENHPHHQQIGFTPLKTIRRVFKNLQDTGGRFDTLILFWLGEPLLHPAFTDIYQEALRCAATGTFQAVEVHTNATHLTLERTRATLNRSPVPQRWHFSLDAAQVASYKHIKGRDRFEEVEANVEAFLKERQRLRAPWPRPVFQFIVSDKNASEALLFRKRWEQTCEKLGLGVVVSAQTVPSGQDAVIFFRQLDCPTPDEQSRQNEVFDRTMGELGLNIPRPQAVLPLQGDTRGICGCFWKSPVVGWDGRLTTCTRDNRQENSLGSVLKTDFSQLWWGESMRQRRAAVQAGDYGGLSACKNCFIPRSGNYTGITVDELGGVI